VTDKPSDKPSQEPTPDALPSGDIDDLLSEATNLADDLAQDVGASDDATPQPEQNAPSPEGDLQDDNTIDAQLEQIEEHLAQTESELADNSDPGESAAEGLDYKADAAAFGDMPTDSPQPQSAEPESAEPEVDKADSDTPAAEESSPESPAPPAESPSGAKVIQLGKRASPKPPQTEETAECDRSPGCELTEEEIASFSQDDNCPSLDDIGEPDKGDKGDSPAKQRPTAQGKGSHATPSKVNDALCTVLGTIDTPFRIVGEKPRMLIGWLALAILFGALVVFALSFLA